MATITVTATDIQNSFGKYLQFAINDGEVIIIKNGKEVARLISKEAAVSFLADSVRGVLKNDYDEKAIREERILSHESINRY